MTTSNLSRNAEEIKAIKSLVTRLLAIRTEDNHYSVSITTPSGLEDIAPPQLIGNIGGITFCSGGKVFGENIVAASGSIKYELADYLEANGSGLMMINATEHGTLFYYQGADSVVTFEPHFRVKKRKTHDSEYILLNALAFFLAQSKTETGNLYLLTERIPCESCTRVLVGFCEKYPEIQISVYYLQQTYKKRKSGKVTEVIVRTSRDFFRQAVNANVDLSWCVIDGNVVHIGKHQRRETGAEHWKMAD